MTSDENRVIVVGSGPSGAAAAHTLASRGIPVTVIEAGQSMPRGLLLRAFGRTVFKVGRGSLERPHIVSSGDPTAVWYSTISPGGLSNYWTGAVPRYSPQDFIDGSRIGAEYCWPVTYEELAPYYVHMERLLRVTGASTDHPAMPAGDVTYCATLPSEWGPVAREAGRAVARGSRPRHWRQAHPGMCASAPRHSTVSRP